MSIIQLIVQTTPDRRDPIHGDTTWRASANRTDSAIHRKDYRGQGRSEREAAVDAVEQLLRDHTHAR